MDKEKFIELFNSLSAEQQELLIAEFKKFCLPNNHIYGYNKIAPPCVGLFNIEGGIICQVIRMKKQGLGTVASIGQTCKAKESVN